MKMNKQGCLVVMISGGAIGLRATDNGAPTQQCKQYGKQAWRPWLECEYAAALHPAVLRKPAAP